MKKLDKITPLEKDFSKWYKDVITVGNLISYGLVKGTIIFKPNGFAIWENIKLLLDNIFKENKVKNVYLPMLIPLAEFRKEKEHIEGFAPELLIINKVGEKEIFPIVVRPTSEIPFGYFFKSEIESYKNLPLIFNQWANIIRWEKTTNPFLRTSEFLWQEGHTAHSSRSEAEEMAMKMIHIYEEFLREKMAIATLVGEKTEKEKFAGAIRTFTIEAMMKDFKAIQAGTSHYLGQNFAKSLEIQFVNDKNQKEYVFQTSWGVSTRLIGALIMSHGDNNGIVIPPAIAPIQIDVIPVIKSGEKKILENIQKIYKNIQKKYKTRLLDTSKSFGFRASQSEVEGVPLRVEIGSRELENNQVILVKRNTFQKIIINLKEINEKISFYLKEIQNEMYEKSKKRLYENIIYVENYDEFKKKINQGFVLCAFDGSVIDEKEIQQETGAISRCIPFNFKTPSKFTKCIYTGKQTNKYIIFAKAY